MTHETRGLLTDRSVTSAFVPVLEVGERCGRCDGVGLVITVVVKRDVKERVVGETKHDVADVVRLRCVQRFEDAFDSTLVLVRCLSDWVA